VTRRYDVHDLRAAVERPRSGTLSRTVYRDEQVKVVAFAFAAGEELSEHTASAPAIIEVLEGRLDLVLDGEEVPAPAGTWVRLAAGLRHELRAPEPALMLLTLLPRQPAPAGAAAGTVSP
jgi:quercetin dioxygenase-like cupin family protein